VWDRIPIGLRGAAVDPTLRGAVGLAVLALVAALIALGLVWRGAPRPVAVPEAPAVVGAPAGAAPGSTASASPSPPATAAGLVVDVAGKVRRPGVVTLPAGARVADALRSAGGVLPGTDTSALSLARKLVDGEQVLVTGRPGPPAAAPSGGAAGSGDTATAGSGGAASGTSGADPSSAGPLDLNAATVEQLDGLPGVGPVLAGRIIEWRTAHNGFASVDQLREVKGLGGKTGTELLPLVRVG
jgi:competence protein ComEA